MSTFWKRRSSAGSAQIQRSYSSTVVAPMTRKSPRVSAGLSMFPASIATPVALPCPTRLCSSSMNSTTSGAAAHSATSAWIRSSY
jgi:S-formylglutathione hydrolase FrmB